MNYIDIIIILFLILGAIRGFFKGFVIGIATLVGLVLGVFLAMRCSVYTENILRDFLNISPEYLRPVGWCVTFLLVVIVTYLLGKMCTKLMDAVSLGMTNKIAGMALGIAKYLIIVCVLLMIVDALNSTFGFMSPESKGESIFYHPFLNFANSIYDKIRY